MLRFASIGSGSRGNGTLVRSAGTTILLDCGFRLKETLPRLADAGVSPESIDAIVVTHEHSDHSGGVGPLARKYQLPVWMTRGSYLSERFGRLPELNLIQGFAPFTVGDITVKPFPVPHDAREACQFVFELSEKRLGVITDLGCTTPHVEEMLDGCHALLLECNHDEEMLQNGPYPWKLKQRIGNRLGHLSNRQAVSLLERLDTSKLQTLVATHLSEANNCPEKVRELVAKALGWSPEKVLIAKQDHGFSWQQIR